MSTSHRPKGKLAAYSDALKSLSKRTGAPLPSLVLSFGILHELTAVVPLVGIFYASRALGVGESIVNGVLKADSSDNDDKGVVTWSKQRMRQWVEEGDKWAARVGRRYGVFGYEKRREGEVDDWDLVLARPGHLAGDVANAVVAYGVTKALLPARIGVSLYFSPAFSRGVVEPIRRAVVRTFRRNE